MTNSELVKDYGLLDGESYSLYLRRESLKKLIDGEYQQDKSPDAYRKSKFYNIRTISYSDYLAQNIDKNIDYAEYICESTDKAISYTDYIAEQCNLHSGMISYSEYLSEKII